MRQNKITTKPIFISYFIFILFLQGSETILNLRSLLTLKTVELNELVHQLELIDRVLINVENGTEEIEIALKDVLVSKNQHDKLLNAEATLNSAIKSACSLYSIDLYSVNNKQASPIKTASIMKKIAVILDELNIKSTLDLYKNGKCFAYIYKNAIN